MRGSPKKGGTATHGSPQSGGGTPRTGAARNILSATQASPKSPSASPSGASRLRGQSRSCKTPSPVPVRFGVECDSPPGAICVAPAGPTSPMSGSCNSPPSVGNLSLDKLPSGLGSRPGTARSGRATARSGVTSRPSGPAKVTVLCRVRPLPPGTPCTLQVDGSTLRVVDTQTQIPKSEHRFDVCLDQDANNTDAFDAAGAPALSAAMQGFNSCVFAYGQTGSGKTHTVLGSPGETGLSPRLLSELFRVVQLDERAGMKYDVTVAFMEIYNESIRDLLDLAQKDSPTRGKGSRSPASPTSAGDGTKRVRQHPVKGIFVEGLCEVNATCADDALSQMNLGMKERSTAPTKLNHRSSRSHAIFQVKIAKSNAQEAVQCYTTLNIVDLAGSENVQRAGVTGERLEEAINVNQSLSTLRLVLDRLVERQRGAEGSIVVPYRNSVLTRVLQDCLGGSSKTTMIACVSGKEENLEATRSTLQYATKASQIMCTPKSQEKKTGRVISDLQRQVEELRAQLADAQTGGTAGQAVPPQLLQQLQLAGIITESGLPDGASNLNDFIEESIAQKELALRDAVSMQHEMESRAAQLEKKVFELERKRAEEAVALETAERRNEEDQSRLRAALQELDAAKERLAGHQPSELERELDRQKSEHRDEVQRLKQELMKAKTAGRVARSQASSTHRDPGRSILSGSQSSPRSPSSPAGRRRTHTPQAGRRPARARRREADSESDSGEGRDAAPPAAVKRAASGMPTQVTNNSGSFSMNPDGSLNVMVKAMRWRMGDTLKYCDRSGNHVEWMLATGSGRLVVQRCDGAGQSPPIEELKVGESDEGGSIDVDLLPCCWYSPLPTDGMSELLGSLRSLANACGVKHNIGETVEISCMPDGKHGFKIGQRVIADGTVGIVESFGDDDGIEITFGKLRGRFQPSELQHMDS